MALCLLWSCTPRTADQAISGSKLLEISDSLSDWGQNTAARDTLLYALGHMDPGGKDPAILCQLIRVAAAEKDTTTARMAWQQLRALGTARDYPGFANAAGAWHQLQGNRDSALYWYKKATRLSGPGSGAERARGYQYMGVMWHSRQPDTALAAYQLAIGVPEIAEEKNALLEARIQNNIGSLHLRKRSFFEAESAYLAAFNRLTETYPAHFPYLLRTRLFLGYVWFEQGRYDEAIYELQTALNGYLARSETTPGDLANCYVRLASAWDAKGDTEKALSFHNEAVEVYEEMARSSEATKIRLAEALNNRALTLYSQKKYVLAIQDLERSAGLYTSQQQNDKPVMATLLTNLAHICMEAGRSDDARVYFSRTRDLIRKLEADGVDPGMLPTYFHYHTQGEWHAQQQEFAEARKWHRLALDEAIARFGRRNGRVAQAMLALAKDEWSLNHKDEALDLLRHAAANVARDSMRRDTFGNPAIAGAVAPERLLEILWKKAQWERSWGDRDEVRRLRQSLATYRRAVTLSDSLELGIGTEGAKYYWLDKSGKNIQEAFIAAARLYFLTQSKADWEAAFYFAEKSKAALLREAWQVSEARSFSGIPDNLLRREARLRAVVSFLERELADTQGPERELKEEQLFATRIIYDSLVQVFEQSYPEYYALKYHISHPGFEDVKAIVSSDGVLLHYVTSDSGVFVVGATEEEVFLEKLPLSTAQTDSMVRAWRGWMQPGIRVNASFAEVSHSLYQGLLAPVSRYLKPTVLVSPDGPLGLIPFEALLSHLPTEGESPERWPYLLRDHRFSYVFSVSLLKEMKEADNGRRVSSRLLAVAPVFGEDALRPAQESRGEDLAPLVYNQEEARSVVQYFPGKLLLGPDAQKARFLAEAGYYGIIHLSSHGVLRENDSRFSFIAFSRAETDSAYGKLYVSDLYNLRIPAQVVVLSACETGVGEWRRGEGVISLARGFSYAGARSIVTTLWGVNDFITARLMEGFYKRLKETESKDKALQQAKLDVANEGWGPYYWAAPILVGDTSPIVNSSQNQTVIWLTLALFLLIGAGGFALWGRRRFFSKT